jgi:hypothetical protein
MDIYIEGEEMTPAIEDVDIENEKVSEDEVVNEDDEVLSEDDEVVSEDDIELESEYERMMTDNNDEDEDDREETNEEDSDEEVIIDKPFDSEQMPHSYGEFAPYFKNITESLFFCWMQKHRICKLDSFETYK